MDCLSKTLLRCLIDKLEQEFEENAREELESLEKNTIPNDSFWTDIWKINSFDPSDIDCLSENLRRSFTDVGICVF